MSQIKSRYIMLKRRAEFTVKPTMRFRDEWGLEDILEYMSKATRYTHSP